MLKESKIKGNKKDNVKSKEEKLMPIFAEQIDCVITHCAKKKYFTCVISMLCKHINEDK